LIEVERVQEGTNRLELKAKARALARRTHDTVATALGPASLPEKDDALEGRSDANQWQAQSAQPLE
jgi:hypothetical protein